MWKEAVIKVLQGEDLEHLTKHWGCPFNTQQSNCSGRKSDITSDTVSDCGRNTIYMFRIKIQITITLCGKYQNLNLGII